MNPSSPQYLQKVALANAIHRVPLEYQPKQLNKYPDDNTHEFERWFKDNTIAQELASKPRTYLPIMWTAYWCNTGYDVKPKHKMILQRFVDQLPRTKKYFTICQYDDGCLIDFKDLDIKIFGMSGGRIDYPIPLLCQPHKFEFPDIKKDIFCSFVGGDTHPIRKDIVKNLAGKEGYYVTMKKHTMQEYCKILARSVFALCPRGYGKTSFRIAEAIHYGAIPVYVSDEFVIPYHYELPGISIAPINIQNIESILNNCPVHRVLDVLNEVSKLYTYPGCKQKILENI
jgi:hypothetical protein